MVPVECHGQIMSTYAVKDLRVTWRGKMMAFENVLDASGGELMKMMTRFQEIQA